MSTFGLNAISVVAAGELEDGTKAVVSKMLLAINPEDDEPDAAAAAAAAVVCSCK
jgi:hypothetical protein